MERLFLLGAIGLLLNGCASNSGVVASGKNTFMVSKQAATGFGGLGTLKAEALQEANQHCASEGKTAQVTKSEETKPPYLFGNYPRVEIEFSCA